MNYNIKITGEGTSKEIVNALRLVATAIENKAVRDNLDSPEIEDLDGAEWEDSTLMTEINVATRQSY